MLESLPTPEPTGEGPAAQPMSRVLLAAAHKDLILNLTGAVRAAGLSVSAVDLVPLALVRSVGRRVADNGTGVEAIVSIGGGVTVVVVHELGIPRFVRILGSGGRAVTDAVARDLELTPDQAEAVKRQLDTAPADLADRARRAMTRPISDLVEQVRGSLDYYRTQPDSVRLLKVTLTGGGALTPGLVDQLVDTVGVPVDLARPREHIAIGDIGFPDDQLGLLDPFLPVPVGLALGGLLTGKRIDLLGTGGKEPLDRSRLLRIGVAAAVVLVLLLGGLYFLKKNQVDDERDKLAAAEAENRALQSKINALSDVAQRQTQIEALAAQTQGLLVTDVAWSSVLQALSRTIPSDVWLTSFQSTVTADRHQRRDGAHDAGRADHGGRRHHRHRELLRRRHELRRSGGVDPPDRHRRAPVLRAVGPERDPQRRDPAPTRRRAAAGPGTSPSPRRPTSPTRRRAIEPSSTR